ncbi:unnamed protein product [Dibothriocephalus latus]|uniref:P-type phospholipid transporter n=1 Tax=Dibothriocephalus latus TaxID=60516 RepID=A0A3P7LK85_DIBLA|nr:unnamed protein product [Dibothriocephalus latus]
MLNSAAAPLKRSSVDRQINKYKFVTVANVYVPTVNSSDVLKEKVYGLSARPPFLAYIFMALSALLLSSQILVLILLLAFLTIFTVIANALWANYKNNTEWYLGDTRVTASSVGFMVMTAFIMFHTIIPISLQVSLEVVRFIQAFFINWDQKMYDPESDTAAMARTSNLNEDLGKVKHIFSDKTGTLTRNVMEFKRCTISAKTYG